MAAYSWRPASIGVAKRDPRTRDDAGDFSRYLAREGEEYGSAPSQRQIDAAEQAITWAGALYGSQEDRRVVEDASAFNSYWEWGEQMPRRTDRGRQKLRWDDLVHLGDENEASYDVVVLFVPDPIPGLTNLGFPDMEYHTRRNPETDAYELRVWRYVGAGYGVAPELADQQFLMDTIVRGLGEIMCAILDENHGAGAARAAAAEVFGGDGRWDQGWRRGQLRFAVVEVIREYVFSGRAVNSQAVRKLRPKMWRLFMDKFVSRTRYPITDLALGQEVAAVYDSDGVPAGWRAEVGGLPFPPLPPWAPYPDAALYGPDDFDAPVVSGGPGDLGVISRSLLWGWTGAGYRRPPKRGSILRLQLRWWPQAPVSVEMDSLHDPDLHYPPGIYEVPFGRWGLQWNARFPWLDHATMIGGTGMEGWAWGWGQAQEGVGAPWARFSRFLVPPEIEERSLVKAIHDDSDDPWLWRRPVRLNLGAPGVWEFNLRVPRHDGTLMLMFNFRRPWRTVRISGDDTNGEMPVRFEQDPRFWWRYPERGAPHPAEIDRGYVQTQVPLIGRVRSDELVVGSWREALQFTDAIEAGVKLTVDDRPHDNLPAGGP